LPARADLYIQAPELGGQYILYIARGAASPRDPHRGGAPGPAASGVEARPPPWVRGAGWAPSESRRSGRAGPPPRAPCGLY